MTCYYCASTHTSEVKYDGGIEVHCWKCRSTYDYDQYGMHAMSVPLQNHIQQENKHMNTPHTTKCPHCVNGKYYSMFRGDVVCDKCNGTCVITVQQYDESITHKYCSRFSECNLPDGHPGQCDDNLGDFEMYYPCDKSSSCSQPLNHPGRCNYKLDDHIPF